MNHYSIP